MSLQHIKHSDAHRCQKIVDECAELWHDPTAWQEHLTSEIQKVIGGFGGMLTVADLDAGLPWQVKSAWLAQDNGIALHDSFAKYLDTGPSTLAPSSEQVASTLLSHGRLVWSEKALVGSRQFHSSDFFQYYLQTVGVADVLSSAVAANDGLLVGNSVFREDTDRIFNARETSMIAFINEAIAARVGNTLRLPHQMNSTHLTLRQKEVLNFLLQGLKEKQIARLMGLSSTTVHEHTGRIYQHFGLHSRAELMTAFIQRKFSD